MTNIEVICYIESHYPLATKALKEAVITVIRQVAPARADMLINISIIGDRKMKSLNRSFRGLDKTTDVLAFSYTQDYTPDEVKMRKIHLGEIVLSYPEVVKRAISDDCLVEEAAQFLVVHGALHLLGFDHEKSEDAYQMERLEDEIMEKILTKEIVKL